MGVEVLNWDRVKWVTVGTGNCLGRMGILNVEARAWRVGESFMLGDVGCSR